MMRSSTGGNVPLDSASASGSSLRIALSVSTGVGAANARLPVTIS